MTLGDLLGDTVAKLPPKRREAMQAVVDEYGADETFRFLVALVAGATRRERQLIRLLLRELEKLG